MKRLFWLAVIASMPLAARAQQDTDTSLTNHRTKYKTDLYQIIKDDTARISFYEAAPKYTVTAIVQKLKRQKKFTLLTSSGKKKEARKYALLIFELDGKSYQLYAYQLLALLKKEESASHLFVPFTDDTNINGSYGGGRYIDLDLKDIIGGKVVLDFNKAYNPYCAFTTGYNCPIPPVQNSLNTAIEAGEKYDAAYFAHD